MRQPNWKRWETILLVDMYYRLENDPERTGEECKILSKILRRSNIEMALKSPTYRNAEGIKMKYQNIRHIVEGKGLSSHSKLDEQIVAYRNESSNAFYHELQSILDCINECRD